MTATQVTRLARRFRRPLAITPGNMLRPGVRGNAQEITLKQQWWV